LDEPRSLLTPAPACEPAIGRRPSRAARRSPHDGRSGTAPRPALRNPIPVDINERHRTAREFAERTLRLTLEVLDHRRAPTQLRPMVDPGIFDVIRTLASATPPGREGARLQRVHLQLPDGYTAEVFGTYVRGPRVLALAAQLTLRPQGWRVSALHIG
jgi:hypothetical protein